ncbi:hypothetical protein KL86DES1_22029 [uncultured Desulfovibrio sp.]|uniref:Uncharacterized protein n=1 Tax=uncultured Desulfovibrio sp. TaxID=167968 RepID=A0A212LAJ1_9BACT|nr:hypothetical protein KL86DES1_22029 [uncultured Desulfovibrio sp.]VZH34923.1 conserved protein of unknown function [Desulfovibrio sp. 86]
MINQVLRYEKITGNNNQCLLLLAKMALQSGYAERGADEQDRADCGEETNRQPHGGAVKGNRQNGDLGSDRAEGP